MPKRTFTGTVVSNKMKKTLVVSVKVPKKHKFYSKDIKLSKRYKVSDELGCVPGDAVVIEEIRPLGKEVCWKVIKKLEESQG